MGRGTSNDTLVMSGLTFSATASAEFNVTLSGLTSDTLSYTSPIVLAYDTAAANNPFNASSATGATLLGSLNLTQSYTAASGSALYLGTQPDASGIGFDLVLQTASTPEPTSLVLAGLAGAPLILRRARRSGAR